MTPAEWSAVKAILGAALECPPAERSAYLDSACGGDRELRRRVESLIHADEQSWTLLEAPAADSSSLTAMASLPVSGERIGVYELLEEIGHGGMGIVYLARRADEQFEKNVAIKLARAGAAGDWLERRFRAERQIVASLDHPNIGRLLDGGATADGRPYLVMEYIEGQPLGRWCDARNLTTRPRLEIFLDVCAAVEYAHQHLVVHRDLKPANILVTDEGTVKLLDFGIAKLIGSDLSADSAERTATLFRLLTPDYASPEQVRGGPITTASDVYALGIVLYELLTGERPYRVTDSAPAEMIAAICEREPARPSSSAKPPLSKELVGDLDTIILMALRKEPIRRYASVGALAQDIRRHLGGLPVEARTDTFGYRAGKFARRHRFGVATTALMIAALSSGLVITLREAGRARAAEARAQRRFNDVRSLANSFLFEIHDQIKDLPGSTPARRLLVKRALEYLDSLSRERAGDRVLTRELAAAYQRVGDVQGNPYQPNLGDLRGALSSYHKAIALLLSLVNRPDAADADREALAVAYLSVGGVALVAGNPQGAVSLSEKGLALRRFLSARNPRDAGHGLRLATALRIHAYTLSAAGRQREALAFLSEQAVILRERLAATPGDPVLRRGLGQNLYVTGLALDKSGDRAAARAAFEEAVSLQKDLVAAQAASSANRRDLFWSLTDLARMLRQAGENDASLQRYEEAIAVARFLAESDPASSDGRGLLAVAHINLGSFRGPGRDAVVRRELSEARALLEPIVAVDPANAWWGSMLADLYGTLAGEQLKSATGRADLESACGLYRKSADSFQRLEASGRLTPDRTASLQQVRSGLAACRDRLASAQTSEPSARTDANPDRESSSRD